MAELQFIVSRLNAPPFSRDLTMVGFDGFSSVELLQTVNDVFGHLDPRHKIDVRDESHEETKTRMRDFLHVLRFAIPKGESADNFHTALARGEKHAVYPLLHYVLSKLPQLEKRAYLARYLVTIKIPQEFMVDEEVAAVYKVYKEAQEEFKNAHKLVDKTRGKNLSPKDLAAEIKQLSDEKRQLLDKIESMKEKSLGMVGFAELHKATSALRYEQEEEAKLQERMAEQKSALVHVEAQYRDTIMRIQKARNTAAAEARDPASILSNLQGELSALENATRREFPKELGLREETLRGLAETLSAPPITEDEVYQARMRCSSLQSEVNRLQREIQSAASKNADGDRNAMFRQQAALVAKKVEQRGDKLDKARTESERLQRQVQDEEATLMAMPGMQERHGKMGGVNFQEYSQQLRQKAQTYRELKAQLTTVRAESVVLHRTETILKGRCKDLDTFMAKLENKRGVSGYTTTQESLEKISSEAATLNQTKGKTLEEISKIVTDITSVLHERKNKLAPSIKELRSVRQEYQEIESVYLDQKTMFQNTAAGLETERSRLEAECERSQEEALREESRFHLLSCMEAIAAAKLAKIHLEEKCERGDEELLPEFKTLKSLYQHKIGQEQNLQNSLRKAQQGVQHTAPQDREQRTLFEQLRVLLEHKLQSCKKKMNNDDEGDVEAVFDDYGGTNIMTLNQTEDP
eukprot:g4026.t1